MSTPPKKSSAATSKDAAAPSVRKRVRTAQKSKDQSTHNAQDQGPASQDTDYEVGYRKPPKHTRFKPGLSGNPKGRPKAAKGLNTLVRETLTQKVAVRTASGQRKISRIEAALQKTVELAMKGNPRALSEIIKLYANAVPEQSDDPSDRDREDDLTATDLAILEELSRQLANKGEQ